MLVGLDVVLGKVVTDYGKRIMEFLLGKDWVVLKLGTRGGDRAHGKGGGEKL